MAAPVILAFVALAAFAAFVPAASAHSCYELVPTTGGCGPCYASTGPHDHRTVLGVQWCSSSGPNPPPGGGCGSLFATDTELTESAVAGDSLVEGDNYAVAIRSLCTRGIVELQFA